VGVVRQTARLGGCRGCSEARPVSPGSQANRHLVASSPLDRRASRRNRSPVSSRCGGTRRSRDDDPMTGGCDELARRLSTTDAVVSELGAMIGAGVFAAPGPPRPPPVAGCW